MRHGGVVKCKGVMDYLDRGFGVQTAGVRVITVAQIKSHSQF